MTDSLELRLQQVAADVARGTSAPALPGLQRRARRRRAALVSAPLVLAVAVVAGAAVALQAQDQEPDSITTQFATDRESEGPVIFTVHPPQGALVEQDGAALQQCLGLFGVTLTEPVALGRAGGATARVKGADNIRAFDGCVRALPGFEVLRSDETAAQAAAAHARWRAADISDYTFRLRQECFCPVADFIVTVKDGAAVGVEQVAGEARRDSERFKLSIDDLFTLITKPAAGVAAVQAVYDEGYGFPTRVDVDAQANAIDDEYSYLVSDVHPALDHDGS